MQKSRWPEDRRAKPLGGKRWRAFVRRLRPAYRSYSKAPLVHALARLHAALMFSSQERTAAPFPSSRG